MSVLLEVLKAAVVVVLVASLVEALVLSLRNGWSAYDWKAAALSAFDFLTRQYVLRVTLPLAFWFDAMRWLFDHRLFTLPMAHWTGWLACFVAQEFCYYWYHRAAHRVRWFWCTHSIHHSPVQLNLSAAYRFGWTGKLSGTLAFFVLAPLLGVPPRILLAMLTLNLLYQFWIHATWIPRLGPLEWIFNTPSAHRVHHASNVEYLDGNYGGVLIVFDRLFGTYIAERPDTHCAYGLVGGIPSYNPLVIEFGAWRALATDLRTATSPREALRFLLKPPGWRPDGLGTTTEERRSRAAAVNAAFPTLARRPDASGQTLEGLAGSRRIVQRQPPRALREASRRPPEPMPHPLQSLLATGADEAIAISAPSRAPLTFGALRTLIATTVATLNGLGIGRNDRVAIVLPNGPEMAICFVACASGVASAPLNPGYRADEFEFYLNDLGAKALIVDRGSASPAVDVAFKLGVRIVDLIPGEQAGSFTLEPREPRADDAVADGGYAEPDDVSMVLHTSGTTSRPKIVPLSQANLAASAGNIRTTLRFTADDCGLNIMPLFHIHGLIAGVLAPLAAGSRVFCTPGFNALKFFGWMDEAKPTWYTAVPTMHQTIVARAGKNADVIARHPLRFMRSSSSSMPPQVIRELEAVFGAPLIESYGMTEATHQMASNPLPPAVRKPGTVGIAAGPEVAIMDTEAGVLLERGATGEIVIRGANVTKGYENNPKANAEGFLDGWFRTGDQGVMDADGYISITGRLKEIINRGGEKVSPREIDEILMDHPAVAQVVCFGMPHDKLGEEVAAVVVLRDGLQVTERDLQAFVAGRAADYKVPKKILFMDEIPKGATGKLQRIGLAQKLGLG